MKNPPSEIKNYKSYIGKQIYVNGKEHKAVKVRESNKLILVYYEIDDARASNKYGVANIEVVRLKDETDN